MRFPETPLGITLYGALMGATVGCLILAFLATWQSC